MASRLLYVGDKFRFKMKKVTGAEFFGQLLDLPDTSRVSNFLTARRYLRTRPTASVAPGDVIIADSIKYIVADHGTGFHFGPIYKHFKLFEVDTVAVWSKKTFAPDSVTGVQKMTRTPQSESVYMSIQPKNAIVDKLNIQQQTYVAIVNRAVSRDDVLDGKIVTKVDKVLGVYALELKEE